MNDSPEMVADVLATLTVAFIGAFILYWSIRGLIQLFQLHNSILVIFYLVFLFPIAYCHMLLLGIFGQSQKMRLQREIEEEANKQMRIEAIKSTKNNAPDV